MGDDDLTDFLVAYAEACDEAGIEPLPLPELASLALAMLTGRIAAGVALH